jgi:hypothetical protein
MGKTIISADGGFEWDEEKSGTNKELHGLFFDEVLPAFDDPYLLELFDDAWTSPESITRSFDSNTLNCLTTIPSFLAPKIGPASSATLS